MSRVYLVYTGTVFGDRKLFSLYSFRSNVCSLSINMLMYFSPRKQSLRNTKLSLISHAIYWFKICYYISSIEMSIQWSVLQTIYLSFFASVLEYGIWKSNRKFKNARCRRYQAETTYVNIIENLNLFQCLLLSWKVSTPCRSNMKLNICILTSRTQMSFI